MLPTNYLNVIKILHLKLNGKIEWYITGKSNLILQGMQLNPSRLGILIHQKDLQFFLDLVNEFKYSEIELTNNKEAEEFILYIEDIEVLVCAEYPHGIYWAVKNNPVNIKIQDIEVSCFSLEAEQEAYVYLSMKEKSHLIKEFLNKSSK